MQVVCHTHVKKTQMVRRTSINNKKIKKKKQVVRLTLVKNTHSATDT